MAKIKKLDGSNVRFTPELPGRVNGRYPKTIFRGFSPDLREALYDIEDNCAALRERMSCWRATLTKMKNVMDQG